MNSAEAVALIERARAHLRSRSQDLGAAVMTRPLREYIDPALYDAEAAAIFARLPLLIGHASQAPRPGDFFTFRLAGASILIVRQQDSSLKAFRNICRHRGAPLTEAESGHLQSLLCPYHGWRYELDGRLANITARHCFPDFDIGAHGLLELPLEVVEGLVFIAGASRGDELQARAWLAPVAALLAGYDLATHRHYRTEIIANPFNWKIGVEGALETYHFRYLHPQTVSRLFTSNATLYDHWDPHQRQCSVKPSLLQAPADAEPLTLLREQILQTYFIFPCTLITVTNDHMLLTFFYPDGLGQCQMVYTLLTPDEPEDSDQSAHWERTWSLTRTVLAEDFAVQNGIQRSARDNPEGVVHFGRAEQGLARFRTAVDQALARTSL
jgi:phenylpropionate dioxygenase-like ring-hydroxylating dioxygenase large terminal subunit